jgi:Tol biopolymer transport system component
VSVGAGGVQANGVVYDPQISADGRFVAFQSFASNLVPSDTSYAHDVFVRDRQSGGTERVSPQTDNGAFDPSISADGRFIAVWFWDFPP